MQITLIRHGKTIGNSKLRYIGKIDEPLAPEGITQVKAIGVDPNLQMVYVSPLQRTQQTAALLFPNARQIIIDDFQEMDFGDFEGRSYNEMADDSAYRAWVDSDCLSPCPNGESHWAFSRRVCNAFVRAVSQAEARGEREIVLVVHGGTIMAVMEHFAIPRKSYYDYFVKNCTGYVCNIATDAEGNLVLTDLTSWEQHL